jgi:hypothetical protein
MSRTSRIQQSHLRLVYSADALVITAHESSRQHADREERRWQLEWARRNVERSESCFVVSFPRRPSRD